MSPVVRGGSPQVEIGLTRSNEVNLPAFRFHKVLRKPNTHH